jgi:transcriptional regulator with PAS, ATPase and Fis domain
MVNENTFRQDLLYRINTVEIQIPPLRERKEDIKLLADHFVDMYCRKYRKNPKSLPSNTLRRLEKYKWPGNIRELQHAIERAVIMSEKSALQAEDFFFLSQSNEGTEETSAESLDLDEVEKNTIKKAINKNGGNISKAAKELGLTRASLYRRLEKHGL